MQKVSNFKPGGAMARMAQAFGAAAEALAAERNRGPAPLTRAQHLLLGFMEGGNSFRDYKAPHAARGTAPRRRRRSSAMMTPRLFKGHRP